MTLFYYFYALTKIRMHLKIEGHHNAVQPILVKLQSLHKYCMHSNRTELLRRRRLEGLNMGSNNKRSILDYREVHGLEAQQLASIFGSGHKFIEIGPDKLIVPSTYALVAERIRNLEVRFDDIWILSYPRTGSNWLQEMVWLIEKDLNFEEAKKTELCFRSVLLEGTIMNGHLYGEWGKNPTNTVDLVENLKSPRHIKCHFPIDYLPIQLEKVKPKIIYVARNPKDTFISLYMFLKLTIKLQLPLEDFANIFMQGTLTCGHFFKHILTYWNKRHEPNVLFLKYEEMKRDTVGVINQISNFLDKRFSEDEIKQLADHLTFRKMSNNPAVNRVATLAAYYASDPQFKPTYGFLRKGEVGDWKNHMSSELIAKFDSWTETSLEGTGLTFD